MDGHRKEVRCQYADALPYPFLEMMLLSVVAGSVFDTGTLGRIFMLCFVVFWFSVVIILIRAPEVSRKSDLIYIRTGLLGVTFLGTILVYWLYSLFDQYGYPIFLEWIWDHLC